MRPTLMALALLTAAGSASAQYQDDTLPPVVLDRAAPVMDDGSTATVVVEDRAPTVVVDETAPPVVYERAAPIADADTLPPVVVDGYVVRRDGTRVVEDCTPPNGSDNCAYFHELIRANFSPQEISMLFGSATAHADYRTNYSRVRERYERFIADIEENGLPTVRPVAAEYDDE